MRGSLKAKKFPELIIFPLYNKFFQFLDCANREKPSWLTYWRKYYFPHKKFFTAYFSLFPLLDRKALKSRVEAVRRQHYSRLRLLLRNNSAERILRSSHRRCLARARPDDLEPIIVYLIIGFFSPEAFILTMGQKKVIVFGLERFRELDSLDLLYAHEYAHLLLQRKNLIIPEGKKSFWYLISEGLACWFSLQVLPEKPLPEHLFLRRDRLNWCWQNEALLKDIFASFSTNLEKIIELEQQGDANLSLPPRTLHFLGYRSVENYTSSSGGLTAQELLAQPERLLEIDLA